MTDWHTNYTSQMKTIEYKILKSSHIDGLEVAVSEALQDGWVVSGDLKSEATCKSNTMYYQALIRKVPVVQSLKERDPLGVYLIYVGLVITVLLIIIALNN